jgi:uncharacterized protein YndB with AHSA1/START domain
MSAPTERLRNAVVDEAIIDADPSTVFKALIDECNGRTHWWMPSLEAKPRARNPSGEEGSIIDLTVHRFGTPKLAVRVANVVEGSALTWDVFEGDSRGVGEWTFEPVAPGKTKVVFRWDVVPKRLLYRVFPASMLAKVHSGVMRAGFEGMNRYLAGRTAEL